MHNRGGWKFPYAASTLFAAAKTKVEHHKSRLAFWEGQQEKAMDTIKVEGIEIDESLAQHVSNSYSRNPQVTIRNDLIKDMQECINKVREHRGKVESYNAWMQVLASQGESMFECNHDDWLFFFGEHGAVTPEE